MALSSTTELLAMWYPPWSKMTEMLDCPTMTSETPINSLPSPARCLSGSAIAGVMAFMMYWMANKIAMNFAARPVHGNSTAAINIAVAVRTLLVGMTSLGTAVFSIISLGLIVLAVKIALGRAQSPPTP
jgi:hypothetical protein